MILAEELLQLTLKKGISEVEVYQVESYSRPISFEANRLKQIETSQTTAIALRLWQNNCPGLAVAYGDFNPEDLIAKALTISQLNPAEEILLNSNQKLIYPRLSSQPDLPKLINLGEKTIASIRQQNSECLVNLELEWEEQTSTILNSRGLHCQQTVITQSASIALELVQQEDFLGIYDGEYTQQELDLDRMIGAVLQKLKWADKNAEISSCQIPILFTPDGATASLWETITEAFNGKYILDKSSPWSESIGKPVVSPLITLSQKPNFQPYNCPFDDEGTITQYLSLIKKGILENVYTDKKTAKKLGIENTANGFRPSLGSYSTPDLVNLIIAEGNSSQRQLINSLPEAIIVDQILGEGADISGDFSFNIDLGYLVKNGEIVGRIKDTMLSGNIYQALQQTMAVGNDRLWSGSCYTPSILIDQLSVITN